VIPASTTVVTPERIPTSSAGRQKSPTDVKTQLPDFVQSLVGIQQMCVDKQGGSHQNSFPQSVRPALSESKTLFSCNL
jgi:hypothetical protein